jgi:hypothetical protein
LNANTNLSVGLRHQELKDWEEEDFREPPWLTEEFHPVKLIWVRQILYPMMWSQAVLKC